VRSFSHSDKTGQTGVNIIANPFSLVIGTNKLECSACRNFSVWSKIVRKVRVLPPPHRGMLERYYSTYIGSGLIKKYKLGWQVWQGQTLKLFRPYNG